MLFFKIFTCIFKKSKLFYHNVFTLNLERKIVRH